MRRITTTNPTRACVIEIDHPARFPARSKLRRIKIEPDKQPSLDGYPIGGGADRITSKIAQLSPQDLESLAAILEEHEKLDAPNVTDMHKPLGDDIIMIVHGYEPMGASTLIMLRLRFSRNRELQEFYVDLAGRKNLALFELIRKGKRTYKEIAHFAKINPSAVYETSADLRVDSQR